MAKQPEGLPAPLDGALPDSAAKDSETTPFSLYLHIPFCLTRCGYCDFNTYTQQEMPGVHLDDYAEILKKELDFAQSVLDDANVNVPNIDTIFIGGGTPTLLSGSDLSSLLSHSRDLFGFSPNIEITVEANPDTVSQALLAEIQEAGVNRLSIGMQSSVPHVLKTLNRTHNPENVAQAVKFAKSLGLEFSLDLIYGTPGESLEDWKTSLNTVLDLEPNHISTYALIVEEGTKLHRQIRRAEVAAPDDDLTADMYESADELLTEAGFSWYELSNWARGEQYRSRHNLHYWTGGNWWGAGPGAHSNIGNIRWWNVKHPVAWAQRLAKIQSPAYAREILTPDQQLMEEVLLKTRLIEGMQTSDLPENLRKNVAALIAEELIVPEKAFTGVIVLTLRGRLLADRVVHQLLAE